MTFAKASLCSETGAKSPCLFNPSELTVSRSNSWQAGEAKGVNAPELRFQAGQSGTLTLSLTFDTTANGGDVTTHTQGLLALMDVDASLPGSDPKRNSGRPPWVRLQWGKLQSFRAVIERLQIKYTYFAEDGTPLRAKADLSLKQFEDQKERPLQNPTSHTERVHSVHRFVHGRRSTASPRPTTATPPAGGSSPRRTGSAIRCSSRRARCSRCQRSRCVVVGDRRLDGAQVSLDGRDLGADLYACLRLVRVEESVQLPDRFELHFDDPHFELFDRDTIQVGSRVEIAFRADADPVVVTTGEVTAIAVEAGVTGRHELVVTGLDQTHRLMRGPRTRTFSRTTDADAASRIARDHGLDVDVDSTGQVHDYLIQAGETDYAFLRRRAAHVGFDFWISDRTFHFKQRPTGPSAPPALTWGGNLHRFAVRFSSSEHCDEVQVRGWDALGKKAVDGRSRDGDPGTDAPAAAQMATATKRSFGSTRRFAPQIPVADDREAQVLATAFSLRASGTEVVLRGEAAGDPALGAGCRVRLEHVGQRLAGTYRLTSVEHLFAAGAPYVTRFVSGGKEPAGLVDLAGSAVPSQRRGWGGLVAGLVTNNDDPEHLGRVKVTFPALSEQDESTWARVAVPGGGAARGWQSVPEVGDEVLVGFELDDAARPLVLGGLWNRKDAPPQADLVSGGKVNGRVLASRKDHRLSLTDDPTSALELSLGDAKCSLHLEKSQSSLTGEQKLVLTATDVEVRATSSLTLSGAQVEIASKGPLTLSGKPIKLN